MGVDREVCLVAKLCEKAERRAGDAEDGGAEEARMLAGDFLELRCRSTQRISLSCAVQDVVELVRSVDQAVAAYRVARRHELAHGRRHTPRVLGGEVEARLDAQPVVFSQRELHIAFDIGRRMGVRVDVVGDEDRDLVQTLTPRPKMMAAV